MAPRRFFRGSFRKGRHPSQRPIQIRRNPKKETKIDKKLKERAIPKPKKTKKKRRAFPSFFHFANPLEIHRERLEHNFNPLVEYLRLKQFITYRETEIDFYGLPVAKREEFFAIRYEKFREKMREIEALILRLKKHERLKQKLKAVGLGKEKIVLKLAKIISIGRINELIIEAKMFKLDLLERAQELKQHYPQW